MNPAKSNMKALLAEEFGRHVEKMGEKVHDQIHAHKGGKEAFVLGAQRVGKLAAHIDKDIEEGVIDEFIGEPLKVAAYAKRYLKRAVGALDNLATAAEIAVYKAEGREIGLKDANDYINGQWKEEMAKLDALKKAIESGEDVRVDGGPAPRGLDGHPGPSLKTQRQAEEGPKKVDSEGDTGRDVTEGQEKVVEKKRPARPKAKADKSKGKKKPKG